MVSTTDDAYHQPPDPRRANPLIVSLQLGSDTRSPVHLARLIRNLRQQLVNFSLRFFGA